MVGDRASVSLEAAMRAQVLQHAGSHRLPARSALPPGQYRVKGFPRFGVHLHRPPPAVPVDPVITIGGPAAEPLVVPVRELETLPRRDLTADFHCVAGWSATELSWEGVAFHTFYRERIEPSIRPEAPVRYVVFEGLDGYSSIVSIEDALDDVVLLADRLDGRPLEPDHGAPVRLVSPNQYGFVSTKHLCRIELHARRPSRADPTAVRIGRFTVGTPFIRPHPRARVWQEERHQYLPARPLRWLYRSLIPFIAFLGRRGSRPGRTATRQLPVSRSTDSRGG